jgi:hypothetical protein
MPMRRIVPLLLLAASACVLPGVQPEQAAQHSLACPPGDVRVAGGPAEDALAVCAAAHSVSAFFRSVGLPRTAAIRVLLVERMPTEHAGNVLGCFTPRDARVTVLSFQAASSRGRWFGQAMDRPLYASLVAHEIAHALAWCNAAGNPLGVRAAEYVAYVAMFATMDPARRQAILAEDPEIRFDSERQISDDFYYIAPNRFAIAAYRHFLRPENGARFLHAVLRAAALPAED